MSLSHLLRAAGSSLLPALGTAALHGSRVALNALSQQRRGLLWSVEREPGHTYKDADKIINHSAIEAALGKTQQAARDPVAIKAILDAAKERSFLTNFTPGRCSWLPTVILRGPQRGQLLT
jgi:hypothetical protein